MYLLAFRGVAVPLDDKEPELVLFANDDGVTAQNHQPRVEPPAEGADHVVAVKLLGFKIRVRF